MDPDDPECSYHPNFEESKAKVQFGENDARPGFRAIFPTPLMLASCRTLV